MHIFSDHKVKGYSSGNDWSDSSNEERLKDNDASTKTANGDSNPLPISVENSRYDQDLIWFLQGK